MDTLERRLTKATNHLLYKWHVQSINWIVTHAEHCPACRDQQQECRCEPSIVTRWEIDCRQYILTVDSNGVVHFVEHDARSTSTDSRRNKSG